MKYYPIPLRVDAIMKGKKLNDEIDIRESIHQNIRLILKSYTLSYRYDASFGSLLNKYQANTPPQNIKESLWRKRMREKFQKNLKTLLIKYETRIKVKDIRVKFIVLGKQQEAVMNVSIEITGEMSIGRREKFHYPDSEITDDAKEVFPLLIPVGNPK